MDPLPGAMCLVCVGRAGGLEVTPSIICGAQSWPSRLPGTQHRFTKWTEAAQINSQMLENVLDVEQTLDFLGVCVGLCAHRCRWRQRDIHP